MDTSVLLRILESRFDSKPGLLVRAPGRVNLLGEHVDYNGGPVLPAAIDRAVYLAGSPNHSNLIELYALDIGEETAFTLDDLWSKLDVRGNPLPKWARYPAGVAWSIQQSGRQVNGLQAVYTSDVPIGAGLSSSAAVEVAFAVLWQTLGRWSADRMTLARLCQKAENEYVGVSSGLMDQFASSHGVRDHALFFDTRSLDWEALPLPSGTILVVADSGVRRSLTTSAYNERRAACETAVDILKQDLPKIQSLRDVSLDEFTRLRYKLPTEIELRAEHVITEIQRVFSAVAALRAGDPETFGELMYAGHASLRDLYQVSTPELDALVEIARWIQGCIGARLTGAGFGGCTINLVEAAHAESFIQSLQLGYSKTTGKETQVYICKASQRAGLISD
jgi:galactokinase